MIDATQTIVITFNYAATSIDFTQADSCREILGFDSAVVTGTVGENVFGDNIAAFNRITSYFIKSNILSGGIPQNTKSTGIITGVPITAKVGSQINYSPKNPLKSNADELIGAAKQFLSFRLLDQLERDVSTAGEEWSLAIVIRYYIFEQGHNIKHSGTHG